MHGQHIWNNDEKIQVHGLSGYKCVFDPSGEWLGSVLDEFNLRATAAMGYLEGETRWRKSGVTLVVRGTEVFKHAPRNGKISRLLPIARTEFAGREVTVNDVMDKFNLAHTSAQRLLWLLRAQGAIIATIQYRRRPAVYRVAEAA